MTEQISNPQIIFDTLAAIAGPAHVTSTDGKAAVAPADTLQAAAVLRFANENGLSISPVGGGTKQGWGNSVGSNIVLHTHRMNALLEHTWQDMTCTVQAGCTWSSMQVALATHGQFVALDPLWQDRASIGGIMATNDSGTLRLKYGGLRDLIIGMTVILADGTVARTGGKVVKNVAGYDLHKLMIGAFGTLGLTTEITFRLHSLPVSLQSYTISSQTVEPLGNFLLQLLNSHLGAQSIQLRTMGNIFALDIQLGALPEVLKDQTTSLLQMAQKAELSSKEASTNVWNARHLPFTVANGFTIKATMLPSDIARLTSIIHSLGGSSVTQATGIMTASLPAGAGQELSQLRQQFTDSHGSLTVLQQAPHADDDLWGPPTNSFPLMQKIKQHFDPNRTLNPGRFLGGISKMADLTVIAEPRPSNFDHHHPPDPALIDDCVHCGFCLPACPTYVLWGEEMDSPRGRIYMMNKSAKGEAPLDQRFQQHMDNCLGCMACMTACPSGVQYNKLIEDTRAQIERIIPRTTSDNLFRKMLFATFPYANRLRLLALPLLIYQRSGLQKFVRTTGLLRLIPKQLSAMEALLPSVSTTLFRRLPAHIQPDTQPRLRVGMLAGCVQQVFFQHVNEATARVLAAEGCEIFIPPSQQCCGALMVHSGLESDAVDFARRMIGTFEKANVDVIAINAAGCGSTMKEYGHLLRDDPEWAARAANFSAKCKDISEILCDLPPQSPRHALPMRIAYHDACHLRHAQAIFEEPRRLLATIPGLQVVDVEEMNLCCGSAGVYNLLHPDAANQLGDRKVTNLLATKAQAVISANPGCLIQLMNGLRRRGLETMPTFHMVELLDASIRGISPSVLLQSKPSSIKESTSDIG